MGAPHLLTPGALPDGFRYHYADDYTGWPVAAAALRARAARRVQRPARGRLPLRRRHRGRRLEARASSRRSGMSHRIFAVESGEVHYTAAERDVAQLQRSPLRRSATSPTGTPRRPGRDGTYVHAGQVIGWTCLNEWHVHLSEWALVNGQRVWVNPLHAGGKLRPYADNAEPVIRAHLRLRPAGSVVVAAAPAGDRPAGDGATSLAFDDLHGAVDLRAWIDDSQGDVGIYRDAHQLAADISPYRIWVQIRRASDRGDRLAAQRLAVGHAAGRARAVLRAFRGGLAPAALRLPLRDRRQRLHRAALLPPARLRTTATSGTRGCARTATTPSRSAPSTSAATRTSAASR